VLPQRPVGRTREYAHRVFLARAGTVVSQYLRPAPARSPSTPPGACTTRRCSRPIDFCVAPDDGAAAFYPAWPRLPTMFRMGPWEGVRWAWLLLKTWAADRRPRALFSTQCAQRWQGVLSGRGARVWRATFGRGIGSDWTNVSLHQAGEFFRKQLISGPTHTHPTDAEGLPGSMMRALAGCCLRGPQQRGLVRPVGRAPPRTGRTVFLGRVRARTRLRRGERHGGAAGVGG